MLNLQNRGYGKCNTPKQEFLNIWRKCKNQWKSWKQKLKNSPKNGKRVKNRRKKKNKKKKNPLEDQCRKLQRALQQEFGKEQINQRTEGNEPTSWKGPTSTCPRRKKIHTKHIIQSKRKRTELASGFSKATLDANREKKCAPTSEEKRFPTTRQT